MKAAREAAREEERLIEEAMERAAAEKAAEGSGLGGMAAGLVRRMGDVFTFGKATTAASAASAEGTAGAAAAGDEVGGRAGDGLSRSGGEVEAQGAGGAADAEAEKQARNRELRAKLKDRKELLRNVDLQALVIVSNASCLRTPCLDVGPWGDLALREDAWCSMGCSPLGRTAYHSLQACRLSTVSRTRPGRCRAKGRRSTARRRPPSARKSRMQCSALSVTDRNLTEI